MVDLAVQLMQKWERLNPDDVVDVPAGTVVRVAPEVVRSVWNDGPDDVELVIVSKKIDDPQGDAVTVPDFWPI